jgi:hypothetical protein
MPIVRSSCDWDRRRQTIEARLRRTEFRKTLQLLDKRLIIFLSSWAIRLRDCGKQRNRSIRFLGFQKALTATRPSFQHVAKNMPWAQEFAQRNQSLRNPTASL